MKKLGGAAVRINCGYGRALDLASNLDPKEQESGECLQ